MATDKLKQTEKRRKSSTFLSEEEIRRKAYEIYIKNQKIGKEVNAEKNWEQAIKVLTKNEE